MTRNAAVAVLPDELCVFGSDGNETRLALPDYDVGTCRGYESGIVKSPSAIADRLSMRRDGAGSGARLLPRMPGRLSSSSGGCRRAAESHTLR
jgi:hypothetical protein